MARIVIEINCDNAAFEGPGNWEIVRILSSLCADLIDETVTDHKILIDVNGNKVGLYSFSNNFGG